MTMAPKVANTNLYKIRNVDFSLTPYFGDYHGKVNLCKYTFYDEYPLSLCAEFGNEVLPVRCYTILN